VRPETVVVGAFLGRVGRRLKWLRAADGAAIGLAAVALAGLAWQGAGPRLIILAALIAMTVGALLRALTSRATPAMLAFAVEQRVPAFKNVLITAEELSQTPSTGYVRDAVFSAAAHLVRDVDIVSLFPARRRGAALVAAAAACAATLAWPLVQVRHEPTTAQARTAPVGLATIEAVDVRVEPPAYTGLAPNTMRNPARIEAIAGSRLEFVVRGHAERMIAETLRAHDTLDAQGETFTGIVPADADGFVALQSYNQGRVGDRRLIGLVIRPDEPPRVRIVQPGHDQRFPAAPHTIQLDIEATDDLALSTLVVRYTKVSGSGERFTFTEGQMPLSVSRRDDRTWTAHATWALDTLHLEPGDMVVYRALASDRRASSVPGGTTESESFIVEIDSPAAVAAPGFSTDPGQDRRAVSQQMVILETERLLAKRATLSAEELQNESAQLAAEQRKVRVEFVFMLGGELGESPDLATSMTDVNEEEEAQHEQELLAGHAANAGYVALLHAIRAMSRADHFLTAGDPATALPHERAALTQLEAALSRRRMLLRAFSTRERLDLSRRLTGSLADALSEERPPATASADAQTIALRTVLADLASIDATQTGPSAAAHASALAERVLRVDASSDRLQTIAADLAAAGRAMREARAHDAGSAVDHASTALAQYLRERLLDAPRRESVEDARLRGAWRDALRSRGLP
jgi:hypothetical protein